MSAVLTIAAAVVGCGSACVAGAVAVERREWRRRRAERRRVALGEGADIDSDAESRAGSSPKRLVVSRKDAAFWGLRYAESVSQRMYAGLTEPLTPSVRSGRAAEGRAACRYREQAQKAGCAKLVSVAAYCEARNRLTVIGALAGILAGVVFSTELAVLLGVAGALFGRSAPARALRAAQRMRTLDANQHLSEMLEVVALGLRSGLTFDRSFSLYGSHFDSEFARSCAKAHRRWALGLTTREEALRDLAASYDCDQLARIVDSVIRSLRFGSALTGVLEEAAEQSRVTYRAALEERVAKAPVKMMLPTGTLILPAMLLLVMGPVLLELAGGF